MANASSNQNQQNTYVQKQPNFASGGAFPIGSNQKIQSSDVVGLKETK
jgi:hypothetical protein